MSATPAELTTDLELTPTECATLHATFVEDANTLADQPTTVAEEDYGGTCVFDSERHRLIGEMFHLLYSENVERDRAQPQALVIKVPQDSATSVDQTFEVLKNAAITTWGTTGYWQGMQEDTQVMEILFYDSPNGNVAQRLVNNAEKVGEMFSPEVGPDAGSRPGEYVLLATVEDIDQTSITPEETESSFPSEQTRERLEGVFPLPGSG